MAPPASSRRGGPDRRGGVQPWPLDALYEILLRLPAKDLGRFRAVCKPWRTLLSESSFIAAHSARHPEPLIVSGYDPADPCRILCDLVDLSGRVIKRIHSTGDGIGKDKVINPHLDLIYIYTNRQMTNDGHRLHDPATGAVFALPERLSDENEELGLDILPFSTAVDFGKGCLDGGVQGASCV